MRSVVGRFRWWFVTCLLLLCLLPVPTSLRGVKSGSNQGKESSNLHNEGNVELGSDGKGAVIERAKVTHGDALEGSIAVDGSFEDESGMREKEASELLSIAMNAAFSAEEYCVLPNFGQIEGLAHVSPCSGEGKALEAEQHADEKAGTAVKDKGQMEMEKITETVLEVLPDSSQANFAVGREGAKVLASNPGAKRVGALLDADADTFMRNDCKDDKWVVIELSQVARVSSVEISQHELYSSRVKEFDVYGMASHPRTLALESSNSIDKNAWAFMGKFEGGKAKGTQSFKVQSPGWVRYLLIRFLTHHGSESVCAINGLAVYGTSAAEELEAQLADDGLSLGLGEPATNNGVLGSEGESEHKVVAPVAAGTNDSQASGSDASMHQIKKESIKENSGANSTSTANSTEVIGDESDAALAEKDAGKGQEKGSTLSNRTTTDNKNDVIKENNQSNRVSQTGGVQNQTLQPNAKSGLVPPLSEPLVSSSSTNKTEGLAGNISLLNETDKVSDVLKGDTLSVGAPAPFDPHDLILPVPKPKQGGTVYEILVQELKATKAQQKLVSKALEAMHRDLEKMATEVVEIRKQSAALGAADSIVSRIEVSEQLVENLRRSMKNQNRAGISLLASCVGILVLNIDIMKPSRKALKLITQILVASNAVLGAFLMLKSTFMSQIHTPLS